MSEREVSAQVSHGQRFKRTRQALPLGTILAAALTFTACGTDDGPAKLQINDDRSIRVPLGFGPVATVRARLVGPAEAAAWIFSTPGAAAPSRAPVIFVHDWGTTDPTSHGPWIAHLVRRGETVIYPVYQTGQGDSPSRALTQGAAGIRYALRVLGIAPPRAVYSGYAVGGALAAELASTAHRSGLPAPDAVVAAYPSRIVRPLLVDTGATRLPPARDAVMPRSTAVIALAGRNDTAETRRVAKALVGPASSIRRYLLVTDPRISEHTGPLQTDGVARRTFWRVLDRAIAHAERGR